MYNFFIFLPDNVKLCSHFAKKMFNSFLSCFDIAESTTQAPVRLFFLLSECLHLINISEFSKLTFIY